MAEGSNFLKRWITNLSFKTKVFLIPLVVLAIFGFTIIFFSSFAINNQLLDNRKKIVRSTVNSLKKEIEENKTNLNYQI